MFLYRPYVAVPHQRLPQYFSVSATLMCVLAAVRVKAESVFLLRCILIRCMYCSIIGDEVRVYDHPRVTERLLAFVNGGYKDVEPLAQWSSPFGPL